MSPERIGLFAALAAVASAGTWVGHVPFALPPLVATAGVMAVQGLHVLPALRAPLSLHALCWLLGGLATPLASSLAGVSGWADWANWAHWVNGALCVAAFACAERARLHHAPALALLWVAAHQAPATFSEGASAWWAFGRQGLAMGGTVACMGLVNAAWGRGVRRWAA